MYGSAAGGDMTVLYTGADGQLQRASLAVPVHTTPPPFPFQPIAAPIMGAQPPPPQYSQAQPLTRPVPSMYPNLNYGQTQNVDVITTVEEKV